jgi:hypothetical protein
MIGSRTGVANPNWSLGRNLENLPNLQYGLFGPQYDKKLGKYTPNIEKSLILDSSLGRRIFWLGRGLATPVLEDKNFRDENFK